MVERRTVAPDVAGSIPVTHPISIPHRGTPLMPATTRRRWRSRGAAVLCAGLLLVGCEATGAQRRDPAEPVQTPNGSGGRNHPTVETRAHVVLVSFDGFRADYLERFDTPSFDRLAARGARARGLVSVFPSLTFPAHYSIATGMHPEAHGIVGNRFFDPERDEEFSYRDRDAVQDGSWWGAEPIWVTAERQGMVTAAYFYPGTEADISGVRPSYWYPYASQTPNADRVRQVLAWLELPSGERPHLATLYFSLVDGAGHNIGPNRPAMRRSVESADRLLGQLMDGVDALPYADRVALVVVSDHGMASPDLDRLTVLPDATDLRGVRLVSAGAAMALHVGDQERSRRLRDELNASLTDARAYLREEVPEHLHHRANRRIGDIVVIPEETGMVRFRRGDPPLAGEHGWDPALAAMHGVFVMAGPGIRPGVVLSEVHGVDIYPLLTHLLDLTPHPNVAGDLASLGPALAR